MSLNKQLSIKVGYYPVGRAKRKIGNQPTVCINHIDYVNQMFTKADL